MILEYTERSLRHLQGIYDFIAPNDEAAAARAVMRIRAATDRLATLPLSGRAGPKGTRILAVPGMPYVVIHRVLGDRVRILAVFHTARNRRQ